MINITDKHKCCGCTACVSVCPKDCISMLEDNEGFLYPVVDSVKCIDCSLCEKVCPVLHPLKNESEPLVFAAINNDESIRMQSSSGGIFTLLAEYVIDRGGVVFGACFDRDWNVVHDYTETKEGLAKFRGSKYVQSNVGNSFIQVKTFLDAGREVLFSGTPCQVAGLKNYLRKPYLNLLTVDLVCHGVPSPYIWRKYLQETVCRVYGIKKNKSVVNLCDYISDISFRAKDRGWKKYNVKVIYRNGKVEMMPYFENPYMNVFLSDLSLRQSCYACPAKLHNVQSDITLADFWGVDEVYPDIYDDKGCGLLFIHSKEKLDFLFRMNCRLLHQKLDIVVNYNPNILRSVNEPINRKFFWAVYCSQNLQVSYLITISKFVFMRIIRSIFRCL
ncbi:Coenzyme F420 hydrogenase/dehydrogenase, beta subunit C-terminal domain [uncultured Bacteroides sp.]|uniref:Coenzyme F420 hydrogenase/dehydrogenase, beta subunit C-terminal domain n=1 Tax=uncultured Bacteroides sp. TaxID=162156 RepID=UPI0026176D06|nr:Coenzyme F420 hydrogenase/dehydrogenase, beta subunit C-terminal domain [uncultured Bacteroides sp.]